jgi:D-amino-acid dehydrogenase
VPVKAIKWLLMNHSPLIIKPMMEASMWRWGFAMLRNCTEARYKVNKARMVRVAEYSRDCLKELRAETGIAYDDRAQGTLQLFRTQKQLDGVHKDTEILDQYGVPYQVLDPPATCVRAGAGRREGQVRRRAAPARRRDRRLLPVHPAPREDGRGAGREVPLRRRDHRHRRATASASPASTPTPAAAAPTRYVLALGSYSPKWLKPLGIDIPVYPVKGFSITVPIKDAGAAPESTIMDETHKVAVTRLGDRIRVGGMAQLSGYDLQLNDARRKTLEFVLTDLFPDAGDLAKTTFWTGLRPMTPDGTPVMGGTRSSTT